MSPYRIEQKPMANNSAISTFYRAVCLACPWESDWIASAPQIVGEANDHRCPRWYQRTILSLPLFGAMIGWLVKKGREKP